MEVVLMTLLQFISQNGDDKTNVQIAKILCQEIPHLKEPSLMQLADLCHCSPSTFSRFLKTVGLENYRLFSRLLKQPKNVYHHEGFSMETYQALCLDNLKQMALDEAKMKALVKQLDHASRVVFVCFPTHEAFILDFQVKMLMEDKYIEVPSLKEIENTLQSLTENDLVIYLSFFGESPLSTGRVPQIVLSQNEAVADFVCGFSNQFGEGKYALAYFLDCLHQLYHQYKDVRY